MSVGALTFLTVNGTHEGDKLAGDDPVEVTILDLFVVLVFLDAKLVEVVPALLHAELESLETVFDRALIMAVAFGGVTISAEHGVVGGEFSEGLRSCHFEGHNHESAGEESRVC